MNNLALFEEKEIRKIWKDEKWYFSVVDVIYVLTESKNPRDYWYRLKRRESEEAKTELSTICRQLKLTSIDGKKYITDCADTKSILRIIQSIPSPKAEPLKMWLANVGGQRVEEINDPEISVTRMRDLYVKKGYNSTWIKQREKTIISRNNLTDEWRERGVESSKDYAILTDEIYKSGFGLTTKQYKNVKKISENKNVRDYMTNIELALTNLGEVASVEIHNKNNSIGFDKLKGDVKVAGNIVRKAKTELEKELDKNIIENIIKKDKEI